MTTPPKPVSALSEEERRDFVEEMHAAVYEEQGLHEVAAGAKDLLPSGTVEHGPWQSADCSRLFLRWYELGFLALYRWAADGSTGPDIPAPEAAALLADPSRWTVPVDWPDWTCLYVTERGQSRHLDEWKREADAIDW